MPAARGWGSGWDEWDAEVNRFMIDNFTAKQGDNMHKYEDLLCTGLRHPDTAITEGCGAAPTGSRTRLLIILAFACVKEPSTFSIPKVQSRRDGSSAKSRKVAALRKGRFAARASDLTLATTLSPKVSVNRALRCHCRDFQMLMRRGGE